MNTGMKNPIGKHLHALCEGHNYIMTGWICKAHDSRIIDDFRAILHTYNTIMTQHLYYCNYQHYIFCDSISKHINS